MVEAVYLVDKQHVPFVEVGEDGGEIARALDRGAAGQLDLHTHFVGDDMRQRGFAQPGRAVQKDVVERLAPLFGGGDIHAEIFLYLLLSDIVRHGLGTERVFLRVVFGFGADDQLVGIVVFVLEHFLVSVVLSGM